MTLRQRAWGHAYNVAMSLRFEIELFQGEDGYWIVECPSLPGCVSQGLTEEEAVENIKDAIRACLDVRREMGLPLGVIKKTVEIAA